MIHNIVLRYKNGRVLKGTTEDFSYQERAFSLSMTTPGGLARKERIDVEDLKAVFFVKSLEGNKEYTEKKLQQPEREMGRKVLIIFTDGETIRGTTLGTSLVHHGFLLFPSDRQSNNKRIFVVRSAVKEIRKE